MKDTFGTPPPTGASHHENPFSREPGRWEKERTRALRTGHVRDHTYTHACEPVLVHERTRWGWLAWPVPGGGSPPNIPHQVAVLTPAATRTQRLGLCWLTRRPAQRIAVQPVPGSLRLSTAGAALGSLLVGLLAASHGVPVGVVLPAILLAPLITEHIPDRLDAWAREHVRIVEGEGACRYLQRLASLNTGLLQAAAANDCYELRRSAEIGHNLLWEAADLLQTRDTRSASACLIARERLMLQLDHQVTQIIRHTPMDSTASTDQASDPGQPRGHYPRRDRRRTDPAPRHAPNPSQQKGILPMCHPESSHAARTLDVYLLFAHDPYYPAPAREINTTVVAAASLLHPRVRQPDGARIHDRLVRSHRPGEIVPLSTLTHELDGGARWPEVGDWEAVTDDLLQLIRDHDCDALTLGLPAIARALVCAGPHSEVRTVDPPTGGHRVYGPADRIEVLVEVGRHLAWAEAGSPLWPGTGLLAPLA